ncbi:endonuclease domain-containing protein [uncultured Brevundimonas sp.]|uniref:endonuclease domain-containing protein n=1 Tax=uncultured Brevundimonas sp. TaxID=213418 RepID=UPI0030EC0E87
MWVDCRPSAQAAALAPVRPCTIDCVVSGQRTAFARNQRQAAGLAERRLWDRLRAGKVDGHRFRRQHPIGKYFADFACDRLRLILEIDGGVHQRDDVARKDDLRQTELETLGWIVLRFTNEEALTRPDRIIAAIRDHARRLDL